jgi:dipeptidyl aminopeptidase/acylaminoacyl peptidase
MFRFRATCTLTMVLATGCLAGGSIGDSARKVERESLDGPPPLIDREVLFGNPEITGGQISPDGRFISFRKPLEGVMNVWVVDRSRSLREARPVTDSRRRPVSSYFWSSDSRYIVYLQDMDGDENYRIYAVDPASVSAPGEHIPPSRILTPGEAMQARIVAVPDSDPARILVALNDRDPRLHDVYQLDIRTGERRLVFTNDENVVGWTADREGNLRLGRRQREDGSWEILRVDGARLSVVYTCGWDESCWPISFHPDGRRVYLNTNRGVDLMRLVLLDVVTGHEQVVDSDPESEADLGRSIISRATGELMATRYTGTTSRVYPQTAAFARDYERMRAALPDGDIFVISQTLDDQLQILAVTSDVDAEAGYLYDRTTGAVVLLYRSRPALAIEHLARMHALRYRARDGLEIPAILTLPVGVQPRRLPTVVLPHGGPWARDFHGYDPWVQLLANRGYAVLQPNFRGSMGYGTRFLNLGNREWGTGAMQHDITDGVRHLIEQGIADPQRIGIMGSSYGGYAALAGLAFTPEVYAAGVSIVGISNIITLLHSIPPYWETERRLWSIRVGDPDDSTDVQRLRAQSPLYSAGHIRAPLLVVHGANDPRVSRQESDQIVAAVRDLGKPVEYFVVPDEGHGLTRRENRLAVAAAIEAFLAEHLGGRLQQSVPAAIRARLAELQVDPDTIRLR